VNIIPHTEYIEVMTTFQTYYAKTIVAADGATSLVKCKLKCRAAGTDPLFGEGIP